MILYTYIYVMLLKTDTEHKNPCQVYYTFLQAKILLMCRCQFSSRYFAVYRNFFAIKRVLCQNAQYRD